MAGQASKADMLRQASTPLEELARGRKDDPEVRALVAESQRRDEAFLAASQKVGGSR